jgi:hypothetical protein
VFEEDDEYDRAGQDDVDVHVARLEEENLTLKERLFLMEQEVGDMRRRLDAIEARFSDGAVAPSAENAAAVVDVTEVGNAAAAEGDAVEQALENGTERGNGNAAAADNNAVEEVLKNDTVRGNANAAASDDNEAVKENDIEMGDADNTFEEKGDASSGVDNAVHNSLENGMDSAKVEPEKSGEEESCGADSEKNADIGDVVSAQDNGQDSRQA